jgi:hypothetical protein
MPPIHTNLQQSPLRNAAPAGDLQRSAGDSPQGSLTQTKDELKGHQGVIQGVKSLLHDSKVSGHALRALQDKEAEAKVLLGSLAIDIATSDLTKTMVIQSRARNQLQNEKLQGQAHVSYVRLQDLAADGMALHSSAYSAQCAGIDAQFNKGELTQDQWANQHQRLAALNTMVANAQDNTSCETLQDTVAGFSSALKRLKD